MSSGFLDKRFVIIAGKGGVGKSTMCAALGLAAARAGKRTIIAELNTREKAPHFFGKPDSGYDAQEIYENLYSINIQPEPALHEYGLMKLKFERVFKLVFENEAMRRLLRMVPGMNELILLGKAFNLEREKTRRGEPVWDQIIVDAPATGHGVSLLRLPQVVLEVSRSGPMADEVRAMRDLLMDPARTMLNLVSLPEEMPVKETIMLSEQVEQILRIPKGYLLINGVFPRLASAEEHGWLHTLGGATADDPRIRHAIDCFDAMVARRELQEGYLADLKQRVPLPAIEVPFRFQRDFGFDAIDAISRQLAAAMV